MILYQCKAIVHSQHHNVYGSGMIGHTDTATLRSVLSGRKKYNYCT